MGTMDSKAGLQKLDEEEHNSEESIPMDGKAGSQTVQGQEEQEKDEDLEDASWLAPMKAKAAKQLANRKVEAAKELAVATREEKFATKMDSSASSQNDHNADGF